LIRWRGTGNLTIAMCGRAKMTVPFSVLAKLYRLEPDEGLSYETSVEIRPTQKMPVIRHRDGQRHLAMVRWGLVPSWAKDLKNGAKCINARGETVATLPSFRSAFRKRRCLVPLDGFYEWAPVAGKKTPHLVHAKDDQPFALAGLWESWTSPDGEIVETCTVITLPARGALASIHDRMPLILPEEAQEAWLDPATKDPLSLLQMGIGEDLCVEPTDLLNRKVS
jgi:putative SOS response-associated peptidase YedK